MIYGDAPLEAAVRRRVADTLTLSHRVTLVGAVPHDRIGAYFSAADIFVSGSHHEGSGYSLIEAMACGVMPCVTDIPSFRALTGGQGRLWRVGDSAACASALKDVAARDRESERVAVRRRYAEALSWDAIGRQYSERVSRSPGTADRRHAMKIALVLTGGLHPSGREQVIPVWLWLLERLASRHIVHAFTLRHLAEPVTYPLAGATVHDLGRPTGRWAQWQSLRQSLVRHGPFDVIHGTGRIRLVSSPRSPAAASAFPASSPATAASSPHCLRSDTACSVRHAAGRSLRSHAASRRECT